MIKFNLLLFLIYIVLSPVKFNMYIQVLRLILLWKHKNFCFIGMLPIFLKRNYSLYFITNFCTSWFNEPNFIDDKELIEILKPFQWFETRNQKERHFTLQLLWSIQRLISLVYMWRVPLYLISSVTLFSKHLNSFWILS